MNNEEQKDRIVEIKQILIIDTRKLKQLVWILILKNLVFSIFLSGFIFHGSKIIITLCN